METNNIPEKVAAIEYAPGKTLKQLIQRGDTKPDYRPTNQAFRNAWQGRQIAARANLSTYKEAEELLVLATNVLDFFDAAAAVNRTVFSLHVATPGGTENISLLVEPVSLNFMVVSRGAFLGEAKRLPVQK